MNPRFLENGDVGLGGGLDAECLVFWQVLGSDNSWLGRRLAGRRRVHVLPATRAVDDLFPNLEAALRHLALSLHVSGKGDGTPTKRLRLDLGDEAVLPVLLRAFGRLALPCAWAFSREVKKSHVRAVTSPFVALAVHEPAQTPLAAALRDRLRSFLLAACPAADRRKFGGSNEPQKRPV